MYVSVIILWVDTHSSDNTPGHPQGVKHEGLGVILISIRLEAPSKLLVFEGGEFVGVD
jgi:hypothetical protein